MMHSRFVIRSVMAKDARMHRLYALFMMILDWLQVRQLTGASLRPGTPLSKACRCLQS